MLQIKTNIRFLVLVSILFLISCNQSATTSENSDKDTTQVVATGDTTSMPAYDLALDPLTVAGANAKLLQDSLGIKMFESWVKPGELAPLHRHPDHAIYVLQGGKVMLYSKDIPGAEKGIPAEFKTGEGFVNGPITDSARNIGNTTIKLLEVDVYRPRNK
ncbi:hypothetical protein OCK74_19860 [Chitinophagaceae bacterium LB-8]|uniref:Cupin domain-containing protein n=1 Tax=Paraflavisolibacter caeni TaxID=2982496 RepID=A0A9X2Y1B2_9BACT|nr:hypothetical protein [Paraflavisolibacter caeni]MCU7551388.1 hypothetical protein [Paraflavisolibacter caeni]